MANLECNAVCAVAITHHFLAKMVNNDILFYNLYLMARMTNVLKTEGGTIT